MSASRRPLLAGAVVVALAGLTAWAWLGDGAAQRRAPRTYDGVTLPIEVTGSDYEWHLRYPGYDGRLGTDDDVEALRHLHLPVGARAELRLHSRDYLYTLAFPELGLKEIAVPDLEFKLRIDASEPGDYELRGDQFCGFSHPDLIGRLVIESPAEFEAWLESRRNAQ